MNVFDADDYKDFLRAAIAGQKGTRGYQARLAEAAGCQKTYLSQVLHTEVQLTPDHAAGLCAFWGFDADETAYFLDLVGVARAGTKALRDVLSARLARTRAASENLARRFKKPALVSESDQLRYYSAWYWSAIHVLCGIPAGWTEKSIAARLKLPVDLVQEVLAAMTEMRLVAKLRTGWTATQRDLHLPGDSALTTINHFNWRQRAMARLQEREAGGLHYTAVHSVSRADAKKMREVIRACVAETRAIVGPSQEEEMVAFTCDFFVV